MKVKLLLGALFIVFLASCSEDDKSATPAEYTNADGIRGGILYDKFWASEATYSFATDTARMNKFNARSDFFRCKQCHGWDLLGNTGSYINRGANASRPHVAGNIFALAQSTSAGDLFTAIKTGTTRRSYSADLSTWNATSNFTVGDQMPDYSGILSDGEIWDLVKFLKEEAIDVSLLYDATYTGTYPTGTATYTNIGKDGNTINGNAYYTANCASCHGASGKTFLVDGAAFTVGRHVRTKPYEDQHKVKFGQLGTAMPTHPNVSISDLKNLYKALTDTTAFPNN